MPLAAQRAARVPEVPSPLYAVALNDLSFGTVLPGIPVTVQFRDSHRAGLFEIRGPAGASVRVDFVLPAALIGELGAQLPVSFGPGDGFVSINRGPDARGETFNPNGPVIASLSSEGRLYIRMGGTALPNRPQPGGPYRATISMTVSDLGS